MRKSLFLHNTVLFLAAFSPAAVRAQFQPPTPDELKMTSDPKAPGADAVFLDIREIDNDRTEAQSFYVRIKVLTEKGKELATVELPYLKGSEKISEIKGRTIHADGSTHPLTLKPEDLLVAKVAKQQVSTMVFTLPSVEVGSILEYTYSLQYPQNEAVEPHWEVQRRYFVHHAYFEYTAFFSVSNGRGGRLRNVVWWDRLPQDALVKEDGERVFKLEVTDIPPVPSEEWMPPIASVLYHVSFFYTSGTSTDFWRDAAQLWSKDVDKFSEPSKALQAAASALVAPGDSDLDKARKLYNAAQQLENTDYSREKTQSERKQLKLRAEKHAEDIWMQKSGSSEEIALLYLALLRSVGLTAYAAKVVDRDKGIFDPGYLNADQFNSTLVVLHANGQDILLDPGEKMCPFQLVNWRHSAATGISQGPQGEVFVTTPQQQPDVNSVTRVGDVYLDAGGAVTGTVAVVMTGQEALRWRQAALEASETALRKQFDDELGAVVPDGVEAHVDHFQDLDQPDKNLMAFVNLRGTIGTATSRRLLVPGYFFETQRHVPFVDEEKRIEPVDMHYGNRVSDHITYHLPQGITVEGAPKDTSLSWPGHLDFAAKTLTRPGQVTLAQTLTRAFTLAKPEEYQDLRGFYQKVAAADQAQLVLAIAPGGKSN
jgi:hypothetical protein